MTTPTIAPAMSMTATARALGMSPATLKKLTDSGDIKCWFVNDSGRYVYSAATVAEHQRLAAHRPGRPTKREDKAS
jgi:CO/xanthine dehydrogenase Mo-binding subunit